MKRSSIFVLFALILGLAGNAAAVVPGEVPEKKIVIVNNSGRRVFSPMIQKGATIGNPDLWMQAIFVQSGNFPAFARKNPYPPFPTKLVSRAYINITNKDGATGLQPGNSVTVTVPFWTQLQKVTDADIGVNNDQFIDWWNADRIYLFEGATALHAAQITDGISRRHAACPDAYLSPCRSEGPDLCGLRGGHLYRDSALLYDQSAFWDSLPVARIHFCFGGRSSARPAASEYPSEMGEL